MLKSIMYVAGVWWGKQHGSRSKTQSAIQ